MRGLCIGIGGLLLSAMTATWADDTEDEAPETSFNRICAACHSEPPALRAMPRASMAELPPEHIFKVISRGRMAIYAIQLGAERQRALAEYISNKPWGSVPDPASEKLVSCDSPQELQGDGALWSGWSPDLDNARLQPAEHAGLTPADLDKLELRWAFGFPGSSSVGIQPAALGDRLFVGSPAGGVYALNAKSGCAVWKFPTAGPVRATPIVAPDPDGEGHVLYIADRKAWLYAIDAETGELRWRQQQETHPVSQITATPVLHEGVLYFSTASVEKGLSASPEYNCCTFRGSVIAVDAATGKQKWQTWLVGEPTLQKTGESGLRRYGPSGVGAWSAATIDVRAGALYVTTGNAYTGPVPETSDAVVALALDTGELRWTYQGEADDAWTLACVTPGADPVVTEECGPDLDFGSSAILRELPNGKRLLLAGQKSGVMHALDPDNNGALVWKKRLSPGGVLGGIEWGFAADQQMLYVPISDVWENQNTPVNAGGLYAVNIEDGETVWQTPAPQPDCKDKPGCNAGQPQAATLTPGLVFSGSMDGHLRAYDMKDGRIVWDVDTKGSHETVNGLAGSGGSLKGAGVTVINGWVYVASGYGLWGMPGNVLLAYGPPKR
jgi:polyvinyl alcohol dehydrogenase (cytochrome)